MQLGEAGEAYFVVQVPQNLSSGLEDSSSFTDDRLVNHEATDRQASSTKSSPIPSTEGVVPNKSDRDVTVDLTDVQPSQDQRFRGDLSPEEIAMTQSLEDVSGLSINEGSQETPPKSPLRTWHWGWGHLPRKKQPQSKKMPGKKTTLMLPLDQNIYVHKANVSDGKRQRWRRHSTGHVIEPVDVGKNDWCDESTGEYLYCNLYDIRGPHREDSAFLKLGSRNLIKTRKFRSSSVDFGETNAGVTSGNWSQMETPVDSVRGFPFSTPRSRSLAGFLRFRSCKSYNWALLDQTDDVDNSLPKLTGNLALPWIMRQWTVSPWRKKYKDSRLETWTLLQQRGVDLTFSCATCRSKNRIILDSLMISSIRETNTSRLNVAAPMNTFIGVGNPLSCRPFPWFSSIEALTMWYPTVNNSKTCYDSIEVSRCGHQISKFELYKCFTNDTEVPLTHFMRTLRDSSSICLKFHLRLRNAYGEFPVKLYSNYEAGTQLILYNILRSQGFGNSSKDDEDHKCEFSSSNTGTPEGAVSAYGKHEVSTSRSQRFFRWLGRWISSSNSSEQASDNKNFYQASPTTNKSLSLEKTHEYPEYPVFSICRQCQCFQRVSVPVAEMKILSKNEKTENLDEVSGAAHTDVETDEDWSKKKGWKSILGGGYSRRRARRLKERHTELSDLRLDVYDLPDDTVVDYTVGVGRMRSASAAKGTVDRVHKTGIKRRKSVPSVLPMSWSTSGSDGNMPAGSTSHPKSASARDFYSSSESTKGASRSRTRSILSYLWGGRSLGNQESKTDTKATAVAEEIETDKAMDAELGSRPISVVDSSALEGVNRRAVEAALEGADELQRSFTQPKPKGKTENENASTVSVSEETIYEDSDSEVGGDPETKKVRRIYPTSDMLAKMELLDGPNLLTFVVCEPSEEPPSPSEQNRKENDRTEDGTENAGVKRARSVSDLGETTFSKSNVVQTGSQIRRHSLDNILADRGESNEMSNQNYIAESNSESSLSETKRENMNLFSSDLSKYISFVSVSCTLYLWSPDAKVVVSDVDGTITRSDLWGHIMYYLPLQDWTHPGVAELFANISRNGYHMMYLTSRAIGQVQDTKSYLFNLKQQRASMSPSKHLEKGNVSKKASKSDRKNEPKVSAHDEDTLGIGGLARAEPSQMASAEPKDGVNNEDRQASAHNLDAIPQKAPISPPRQRSSTEMESKLSYSQGATNEAENLLETTFERLRDEFYAQRKRYLQCSGYSSMSCTLTNKESVTLPPGPVITSPDRLFDAVKREVILRKPQEFKISALKDIKGLFGHSKCPFYAGFGNRDTDVIAYKEVGIRDGKIFIINPKGEIHSTGSARRFRTSYIALNQLVDTVFPVISSNPAMSGFNTNRSKSIESTNSCSSDDKASISGRDLAEDSLPLGSRHGRPIYLEEEFNDVNYWKLNPPRIIESSEEESQGSDTEGYESAEDDGSNGQDQDNDSWRRSDANPLRLQSVK